MKQKAKNEFTVVKIVHNLIHEENLFPISKFDTGFFRSWTVPVS